jgi:hypothetical protein
VAVAPSASASSSSSSSSSSQRLPVVKAKKQMLTIFTNDESDAGCAASAILQRTPTMRVVTTDGRLTENSAFSLTPLSPTSKVGSASVFVSFSFFFSANIYAHDQ